MPPIRLREMRRPTLAAPAITLGVAATLAACGSSEPQTSRPAHTVAPHATPRPTPLPPDAETITVLQTGVGTFDLATIPVAVIRNDASRHGAAAVVVHFATKRGDAPLGRLDSLPVNMAPGETLPVAADCTDACVSATATDATVSVGAWLAKPGQSLTGGGAAYACGACRSGHDHADVTGTLSAAALSQGAAVAAFAACHAADGGIVGGGFRELVWPGGTTLSIDVPVLVNSAPANCELGASTRW
jgi:hypothetical protein